MSRSKTSNDSTNNSGNSLYGYAEKLSVDHTDGKAAVLTIETVAVRNFAPQASGRKDWKLVLTYVEFPGVEHAINRTSWKTLSSKLPKWEPTDDQYGKQIDNHPWIGQQVAVAPTTRDNPQTKEAVEKLDIAAPSRWDKMMESVKAKRK